MNVSSSKCAYCYLFKLNSNLNFKIKIIDLHAVIILLKHVFAHNASIQLVEYSCRNLILNGSR